MKEERDGDTRPAREPMDGGLIRYEVANRVAVITINRPEVRNAINYPTAQAIAVALDMLDDEPGLSVGVLTGSGQAFSAGMDLKAINAGEPRPITESRGVFGICGRPPEKPLIAAIEGFALGGGLEIALACDLIVASSEARLGLPEVKRGLVAAAGGVIRLPRRLPQSVAMELALTGATMPAQRGLELGLISRITEPGGALRGALELAQEIAANAPLAVRTAKRLVNESIDWTLDEAFDRQQPFVERVRNSEDAIEGARAFVEKRTPTWTGR